MYILGLLKVGILYINPQFMCCFFSRSIHLALTLTRTGHMTCITVICKINSHKAQPPGNSGADGDESGNRWLGA